MEWTIQTTAPYDWDKLLRRVQRHHELAHVKDGVFIRAMRSGYEGKPYLVKVKSTGTIENPSLHVCVDGHLERGNQERLEQQIRSMLTTDAELLLFYEHMREDPVMHRVTQRLYGLRLLADANVFECMIRTIIGQQLNISFAASLVLRLMNTISDGLEIQDGERMPVFPSPSEVASLSVERLRGLQFSQRKAEYIIDFARAVVAGQVDLDALATWEDERIFEELTRLRGIGQWTVECVLLFGLQRPDLLPAADIGVRNAIRNEYRLSYQPTAQEVRELGERWSPYRSYASYYLWETLSEK
jgi:DNA-3-methyladenine glycosylase II